jgi:hypothetical protein
MADTNRTARNLGTAAYYRTHAAIGDSTSPHLSDSCAALRCPADVDPAAFVAGWRAARDTHHFERAFYTPPAPVELAAFIPLAMPAIGGAS